MGLSLVQRQERIAILMRGGAVNRPTPEEQALVLARGGGTPRERDRLEVLKRTGNFRDATPVELEALRLMGTVTGPLDLSPVQREERLAILMRGGAVDRPTPEERAWVLAKGGGTARERERLDMLKRTGYYGEATHVERLALRLQGVNV
ncbi:MAG: hypothetical protein IT384_03830 [Deltaproteobacteria bacterium]|nr:hypothetical protein [Deltaproteobacteria bacterium]